MINGYKVKLSLQIVYMYNFNRLSLSGPSLPNPLMDITQSTAPLGKGQAIFGGHNNYTSQNKIYVINCFSGECLISQLKQEISAPRSLSMVIPLPDTISGCVTGGTLPFKMFCPFWSVWCKMALAEVGV